MSIFEFFARKKKIPCPWKKYYTDDEFNMTIPNISLYEQIYKSYKNYPNNIAYKYFTKSVTYKKFIKQIDRAAMSFKKLNIKKGDIVTICLPNVPEALISFYALNKLGAIANMVHPLSAEEEIKDSLNKTNSKYLIMVDMFYSKIKLCVKSTSVKKVIFVSPANSMNIFMKIGYFFLNIKNIQEINFLFLGLNLLVYQDLVR